MLTGSIFTRETRKIIAANELNITSCMAANADATCRAIAAYLGARLASPTRFVDDIGWEEREELFDRGQIHVCWICGLPYVWKADMDNAAIELCTAPVMQGARYGNRPVYFSDVVVHRDSRFKSFADLRGASWAYNERRSHSGYNVVRHHLSTLNEPTGYFSSAVESGAHQASLDMILSRQIDASAIDSTVLDAELRRRPHIQSEFRIIETLGPSPMPPWVVLKSLPLEVRTAIARLLFDMHNDAQGREILARWGIARFAAVEDADYDLIRRMASAAENVALAA